VYTALIDDITAGFYLKQLLLLLSFTQVPAPLCHMQPSVVSGCRVHLLTSVCKSLMNSQLRNTVLTAHHMFPNCIIIHWASNNSSCHDSMPKDALSVTKMDVSPGGKQPNMYNTIIPHDNPFGYGGQPQSLVFPLNLPDNCPYKTHQGKWNVNSS